MILVDYIIFLHNLIICKDCIAMNQYIIKVTVTSYVSGTSCGFLSEARTYSKSVSQFSNT